jgi:uncharacterized protein YegP (UPF0339 family)
MTSARFEYYEGEPDPAGARWRWRLVAANGEPVASGEAYATEAAVLLGIGAVRAAVADVALAVVQVDPPAT